MGQVRNELWLAPEAARFEDQQFLCQVLALEHRFHLKKKRGSLFPQTRIDRHFSSTTGMLPGFSLINDPISTLRW